MFPSLPATFTRSSQRCLNHRVVVAQSDTSARVSAHHGRMSTATAATPAMTSSTETSQTSRRNRHRDVSFSPGNYMTPTRATPSISTVGRKPRRRYKSTTSSRYPMHGQVVLMPCRMPPVLHSPTIRSTCSPWTAPPTTPNLTRTPPSGCRRTPPTGAGTPTDRFV